MAKKPPRLLLDLKLPDIPTDKVKFSVEVDRSRCKKIPPKVEAELAKLEKNGLTTSIDEIVAHAAMHFVDASVDRSYGMEQAQLRNAWSVLADWELSSKPHKREKRNVLVVADQKTARVKGMRSEVLALGVALKVAIRIYRINYASWQASPGLACFDLFTFDPLGNLIKVEARGRVNRDGLAEAIRQVHKKFKKGDFSRAAGIVYFPRTGNDPRKADVLILDPEGNLEPSGKYNHLRLILLHYAPFFEYQGGLVRRFGERLRELATSNDDEFATYLQKGDAELTDPATWPKRTAFTRENQRFVGTAWMGVAWPKAIIGFEPPEDGGFFYWGLWSEVVDALRNGNVESIANMEVQSALVKEPRRVFILLEDATALAWAPTSAELKPSMFD